MHRLPDFCRGRAKKSRFDSLGRQRAIGLEQTLTLLN
jgi:hypothetical protein